MLSIYINFADHIAYIFPTVNPYSAEAKSNDTSTAASMLGPYIAIVHVILSE